MKLHFFTRIFAFVLCLGISMTSDAGKRGRVIDFEDELVEGVNKRPYDSVSQIGERGRHQRKLHLYRKRQGFRNETEETLSEMRMWQ